MFFDLSVCLQVKEWAPQVGKAKQPKSEDKFYSDDEEEKEEEEEEGSESSGSEDSSSSSSGRDSSAFRVFTLYLDGDLRELTIVDISFRRSM